MNSPDFHFAELSKRLSHLPAARRTAFAASCCERLLPNYVAFTSDEDWGNAPLLREALDEIWLVARGRRAVRSRISTLRVACEAVVPDTEDFSSRYVSAALDAATAILSALECCLDGDPDAAAAPGILARDTIDMFIQLRDGLNDEQVGFEAHIENDVLMMRELSQQQRDLLTLALADLSDEEVATRLRRSSKGRGNIVLGK